MILPIILIAITALCFGYMMGYDDAIVNETIAKENQKKANQPTTKKALKFEGFYNPPNGNTTRTKGVTIRKPKQ